MVVSDDDSVRSVHDIRPKNMGHCLAPHYVGGNSMGGLHLFVVAGGQPFGYQDAGRTSSRPPFCSVGRPSYHCSGFCVLDHRGGLEGMGCRLSSPTLCTSYRSPIYAIGSRVPRTLTGTFVGARRTVSLSYWNGTDVISHETRVSPFGSPRSWRSPDRRHSVHAAETCRGLLKEDTRPSCQSRHCGRYLNCVRIRRAGRRRSGRVASFASGG